MQVWHLPECRAAKGGRKVLDMYSAGCAGDWSDPACRGGALLSQPFALPSRTAELFVRCRGDERARITGGVDTAELTGGWRWLARADGAVSSPESRDGCPWLTPDPRSHLWKDRATPPATIMTSIGNITAQVPGPADAHTLLERAYGHDYSVLVHFPMCRKGEHATYLAGHFVGNDCRSTAKFSLGSYLRLVAAGKVPACAAAMSHIDALNPGNVIGQIGNA